MITILIFFQKNNQIINKIFATRPVLTLVYGNGFKKIFATTYLSTVVACVLNNLLYV